MKTSSDTKKDKYKKIHEHSRLTKLRRKTQICSTVKVKIDESKLSNKQEECIGMMFIEAKWLHNDILSYGELTPP